MVLKELMEARHAFKGKNDEACKKAYREVRTKDSGNFEAEFMLDGYYQFWDSFDEDTKPSRLNNIYDLLRNCISEMVISSKYSYEERLETIKIITEAFGLIVDTLDVNAGRIMADTQNYKITEFTIEGIKLI